MSPVTFERAWAMASPWTFSIPPIADWIKRQLPVGTPLIVDPFAGRSKLATYSNDIETGSKAVDWLASLKVGADVLLFDPPYSTRQITEHYAKAGLVASKMDTSSRFYASAKDLGAKIVKPGGVALSFGWNSGGLGLKRGFVLRAVLLVAHGGSHNDTICVAEVKK